MTVQPVEPTDAAPHHDAALQDAALDAVPTLAEITTHTSRTDRRPDPALAEVLDLDKKRGCVKTAESQMIAEKAAAEAARKSAVNAQRAARIAAAEEARLAGVERQRATEFCRVCDEAYVTNVAWNAAPIRQRMSWQRLEMKRQAPDRMCTDCVRSARSRMDQVIGEYSEDIFAVVRQHPTAKKISAPASRHDANGGAAAIGALSPRRQSYDDLIAEDPRSAALTAYAEVASSLPVAPGRWILDGICGDADGLDFFAKVAAQTAEAKQRCLSCPVLTECLDYALRTPDGASDGVWGGMSKRGRKALRTQVRRDAAAALGTCIPALSQNATTA